MTDEIASFKVTAADIQKQEFHPSGDVHMPSGGRFTRTFVQPSVCMIHTPCHIKCIKCTHVEISVAGGVMESLIGLECIV